MMMKNKFLIWLMAVLGTAELGFIAWAGYFHYMCMDHAEHIHAAWLVWQGEVPYRDFFEHHNPLLWYVLAPVVAAFYKNAAILYVSRAIALLAYGFMFAGFYKLCREFFAVSKTVFALALMLYFLIYDNYYLLFELQPDAMMWGCFFWGLLFFCRFVRDGKSRDIQTSFILFALSFLFLQKIAMLLAVLGVYTLWLMWRGRVNAGDVWRALPIPLAMGAGFALYLYYTNSLMLYLTFNYDLNYQMQEFMGNARILQNWLVVGALPVAAILTLPAFLESRNRWRELLCWLMFLEFIGKMAVGAPYVQYFIFSNLVAALIVADYVAAHIELRRVKALLAGAVALALGMLWRNPPNMQFPRYYDVNRHITAQARENEPILNSVYFFFNLYGSNPSYYWFGHGNIAPVAHYLYGYGEAYDFNKILREKQPKYVYLAPDINLIAASNVDSFYSFKANLKKIWEKMPEKHESEEAFVKRWTAYSFGYPDIAYLQEHYDMTKFSPLVVRKELKTAEDGVGEGKQ